MRSSLRRFLQPCVTIAALAIALAWIDIGDAIRVFSEFDGTLIATVLALTALRSLFLGLRCWRLFAGGALTLPDAVRGYLLGAYISLFLPTAIGGDAARIDYIAKRSGTTRSLAAGAALTERTAGLIAMATFLFILVPLLPASLTSMSGLNMALLAPVLIAACALSFWALSQVHRWQRAPEWLRAFGLGLKGLGNRRAWPELLLWSICAQGTMVLMPVCVALSSSTADLEQVTRIAAIAPVVWLVSLLPISFGGNGLREVTYVGLAKLVGIDPVLALSAALTITASNLLRAVSGAFVLRTWSVNRRDERSPQSL